MLPDVSSRRSFLPFAYGWDPRSEPSNVKEQIMFTASGTSCQNGFICPERGITLPSAKYDHLYIRTLPGRTKRYILASARVGRAPLRPRVLSVWPRAQVPTCQAARSQSDVEMGQACPWPLRPRELWRQKASVLTHVTGRSVSSGTPAGQVTPRPTRSAQHAVLTPGQSVGHTLL